MKAIAITNKGIEDVSKQEIKELNTITRGTNPMTDS